MYTSYILHVYVLVVTITHCILRSDQNTHSMRSVCDIDWTLLMTHKQIEVKLFVGFVTPFTTRLWIYRLPS